MQNCQFFENDFCGIRKWIRSSKSMPACWRITKKRIENKQSSNRYVEIFYCWILKANKLTILNNIVNEKGQARTLYLRLVFTHIQVSKIIHHSFKFIKLFQTIQFNHWSLFTGVTYVHIWPKLFKQTQIKLFKMKKIE
jgi:hypothetical protein